MDTSIVVALITSGTGIIIAGIGAWASTTKAITAAVAERDEEIGRQGVLIATQREKIETLGGDPHDL